MTLPRHIQSLDALRGVAIALVIASHAFPLAQHLPWAIKRFSNLGFFGVQLFFVVSGITLANSWRRSAAPSLRRFALRRIFRIVPAYFLAAAGYALLRPNGHADWVRLVTFVTFTSGWSPAQMPTVPGAWVGVPGGWSIEAEVAFYALFPILILKLRSLGRTAAACVLSLPLAWAANWLGWRVYAPVYGHAATDQFLYYWLPSQMPVFLLGLVAYEAMVGLSPGGRWQRFGRRLAGIGPALCVLCLLAFMLLAFLPWPRLPQPGDLFVPVHWLAAVVFAAVSILLALRPWAVIVNRCVAAVGQASFSAYLLHFAVIDVLQGALPTALFGQTGWAAALCGFGLFLAVFGLTAVAAQISYRLIEAPGIWLGARAVAFGERGGLRAAHPTSSTPS